jgi:hypothetical protein
VTEPSTRALLASVCRQLASEAMHAGDVRAAALLLTRAVELEEAVAGEAEE